MDPATINVNVLRRHDPNVSVIVDHTSYVVLYRFAHGAWSKTGLEGTLFIYQRDVAPYFGVFVLNRQGLNNFCEPLVSGWDVDLDDGLVIWRNDGATGTKDEDVIHGIWVYESDHRERLVDCMQKIIALAEPVPSDEPGREPTPAPPPPNISHPVPRMPIIPSGQSISLDELFGVSSVTAEPPPVTSQLPLPSHAGDDDDRTTHRSHATGSSRDRDVERDPPQPVKSPDPSDLPKGMELLNSLFQRAGVKGQSGAASGGQGSPQDPSAGMQQPPRGRRRSSADDSQNYQPASYGQPLPQPSHSGAHHMNYHSPQQASQPRDRGNSQSRRSSGGSSHGRPSDHAGQKNIDPAEARMGILTAINHPAAAAVQQMGSPSGAQQYANAGYRPPQGQQAPQPQVGGYGPPQGPSHYQSSSGGVASNNDIPGRTPPYGPVTFSQYNEQHPPGYSNQGYQPQPQPPQGEAGLPTRRSPVRNTSPPKHLAGQQGGGQAGGAGGGQAPGAVFAQSVWPFDNLPKRALSPLNPLAAQQAAGQSQRGYQQLGSHSHHQHQQYGHHAPNGRGQSLPRAPGSQTGSVGSPGNQAFSMSYGSPQAQGQQAGVTSPPGGGGQQAYPPQVNDSSRPRQGSQGSQHRVVGQGSSASAGGTTPGGGGGQMLSPKWAAEAVDAGLAESGMVLEGMAGGGASMEKREFKESVVHMLQTNPHFLNAVYAHYLRRCAEDRL